MRKQKGQAAILIIFVIGMVSVLIGISLVKTGFGESIMGRNTSKSLNAFYAANSGIEEAMYRIGHGASAPQFSLPVGIGGSASVTITDILPDGSQKMIESVGSSGRFVRVIKTKILNASVPSPFKYAIQAGEGGLEFTNKSFENIVGDIYSGGNIKGYVVEPIPIVGQVSAVGSISDLNITGNAQAENKTSCSISGTWNPIPATVIDPPPFDLTFMYNNLTKFPSITPTSGTYSATGSIGNVIINGNLDIGSGIEFTGPVWVTGTVTIKKVISLSQEVRNSGISQIIVSEKRITVNSGSEFTSTDDVFLLLISTYNPHLSTDLLCDDPSIRISSNVDSILYYAPDGCLDVDAPGASRNFVGSAVAKKIRFKQLQHGLEFDTALGSTFFGLTESGGWQMTSFKEE